MTEIKVKITQKGVYHPKTQKLINIDDVLTLTTQDGVLPAWLVNKAEIISAAPKAKKRTKLTNPKKG